MADRQQFLKKRTTSPELQKLLDEAKKRGVTEEELHEQRISFAYGNALGSDTITKDSVRRTSEHIRIRG